MDEDLKGMIEQMQELSESIEKRKRQILGANQSDFILAFVSLTKALQTIRQTQETLEPRADFMVHNERQTIKKLRKEQFRVL